MAEASEMPYVDAMGTRLLQKRRNGVLGVRMFVQRSDDASYDDIAREFREMELIRMVTPYDTVLDF